MDALPDACWVHILSHMAIRDVIAVGLACKATWQATQDPLVWQELARSKWGKAVPAKVTDDDWKRWSCHRLSIRTIRQSPLQLLQESYPDPWQHITACVLCSRTSGSEVISSTISRFFTLYPTPSAVLAEARGVLEQVLHPLGLQPVRARAVQEISRAFLETDWQEPNEFWGCGKFATDSWRIFCRGDLSGKNVDDANLRAYISWAKSAATGKPVAKKRQRGDGQLHNSKEAAGKRANSKRTCTQDKKQGLDNRVLTRAMSALDGKAGAQPGTARKVGGRTRHSKKSSAGR